MVIPFEKIWFPVGIMIKNLFKSRHISTISHYSQTSGALVSYHLSNKGYLKRYIKPNQTGWSQYIQFEYLVMIRNLIRPFLFSILHTSPKM